MATKEFIESFIDNTLNSVEVNNSGIKEIIILRPKKILTNSQIIFEESKMLSNGYKVQREYETIYYFVTIK